jgi:hypothetical protein
VNEISKDNSEKFEVDAAHPIPNTEVIDVTVSLRGGGAIYGLVIAQPLNGDARSQARLLRKLDRYLNDFHSVSAKEKFGPPRLDRSKIHVHIHPNSDPKVFELLQRCKDWIQDNSVSFEVGHYVPSDDTQAGDAVRH